MRWSLALQEYRFQLLPIGADMLSRLVYGMGKKTYLVGRGGGVVKKQEERHFFLHEGVVVVVKRICKCVGLNVEWIDG